MKNFYALTFGCSVIVSVWSIYDFIVCLCCKSRVAAAAVPPPEPEAITIQCVVCMNAVPTVILEPCGHLILCEPCLQQLPGGREGGEPRKCPKCRAEIDHARKVIF